MDVSISRDRLTGIALAASASLNIALLAIMLWPNAETPDVAVPAIEAAAVAPADTPEAIEFEENEVADEAPIAAPGEQLVQAAPAIKPVLNDSDVRVTVAALKNSIPQTLAVAAEPYGDFVSATLSRVLVWDLDLRKDLRPGDNIEVAWTLGTTDTVVIEGARYFTEKHNKTINAYRFKATGDTYASYWSADGTEVPHRLRNSPLAEYEQITSLLRDRPTHHGMDFKVATGTPVVSGFDGVVTRVNWNWNANGNCVEVQHKDGVLAKYLHLSDSKVKAGARVHAGEVIALSGNTGHSTGPHLHYQLNQGTKVIDPITYHGTDRRPLPAADKAAFNAVVAAANAQLDAGGTLAAN
jgi:murein DD-endopeptidase